MIQKIYMPEYVLVIAQACGAVGTLRKTARGEEEGCVRAKVPPAPLGASECLWDAGVCHY